MKTVQVHLIIGTTLVYAAMERQRQELGLGNTNGRLAFYLIKSTSARRNSHVIHKTENLLDVIYDNFDCPLFEAKYHIHLNIRLAGNSPAG